MQDKIWYSILGLDAEPLFLQDHMLSNILVIWSPKTKLRKFNGKLTNQPKVTSTYSVKVSKSVGINLLEKLCTLGTISLIHAVHIS